MNKRQGSSDYKATINRELKIEEEKDFHKIEEYLHTVSKRFMKEPITLEKLDQVYSDLAPKKKISKFEKTHE